MLTGVVALLLLLIILLAIPLTLTFQISWQQYFHNDMKLQWAFGLVRIRIRLFRPKSSSQESEELEQKILRFDRLIHNKHSILTVVRQEKLRRRMVRYISDLWHAVHKKNVSLRVRIGLGDPADTGQLWAICGPLAGILGNVRELSIRIEPEFIDGAFELDSRGSIRIVPLRMVYLTVALLLSPPVWQGIKQMRMVGK